MIYCFASFDNWQMETTRCRAREGGKLLSIRTPLTFTVEQRNPILCCLLQRSCAGFEQLQRLCRHMERQPALLGVPVPSSCVLCPVLHGEAPLEPGSSAVSAWEQNAGNSSIAFEKLHRTEHCRGSSSNFWDKGVTGSLVLYIVTVDNR